MRRAILLGDSPFLGEIELKLQYVLDRYYSIGINRIITKFKTNSHILVDMFLLKLAESYPEVHTVSLYKYGDLIRKKDKELYDTFTYNFHVNDGEIFKKDKLAWCGFTHDYALSYLIHKGYEDIILIGAADFTRGAHFSNPYDLKCADSLKNTSKRFIEEVCSSKVLIRTCNPNSILDVPRISIDELLV